MSNEQFGCFTGRSSVAQVQEAHTIPKTKQLVGIRRTVNLTCPREARESVALDAGVRCHVPYACVEKRQSTTREPSESHRSP
jgi:hypothetical protein